MPDNTLWTYPDGTTGHSAPRAIIGSGGEIIPPVVFKLEDGSWDYAALAALGYTYTAPEDPTPSLEDAKTLKLAEILGKADMAAQVITAGYSAMEQSSWPQQRAEAEALKDDQAAAPLLRGIADVRGIDVLVLRDKVLANVAKAEAATIALLGQQQSYEDQVRAVTVEAFGGDESAAISAVIAVDPVYSLSE